jgi:two-component system phosphate regulon sensor histidine kinase PhoR
VQKAFSAEIWRGVIFISLCLFFGFVTGYIAWSLVIGFGAYCAWMLWQVYRLEHWLLQKDPGLPPEADGAWGNISDRIYHLKRRDNREKQRLQSLLNRVEDTTAALPDAVILIDPRGNMTWWNETASELLKFQPSDQQSPLVNYIRDPQFIDYFEAGKYKEPFTLPSPHRNNQHLQFQITRYGQDQRLVLVRDISRIHRLEQMRKDFVANVSHELRTPLTVIKGYLETLSDNVESTAPKWLKPLQQMQQQCERMSLLVNDLITLSRLETEDPQPKQTAVDIVKMLAMVRGDASIVGQDNYTLTLTCDCQKKIRGNQKELQSAISNIVINAITYSPKGSHIDIRYFEDNKGLHVSVQDDGIGIDPVHVSRLTERFYRVDASRSINTGGTGLGLAIVKHVLLRHDGRLDIKSELGKGSIFTCSFPLSRIAA